LSGYLITRSLLLGRLQSQEPAGVVLRRFYVRRWLHICPLYYATCAIAAWQGWMTLPSGLPWHLAFLSNFYFIRQGGFVGASGHLWAVAVEQHFYLFWPLVILWIPPRYLRASALGFIAIGLMSRTLTGILGGSKLTMDLLTPHAFECLGTGALLATSENWALALGISGLALLLARILPTGPVYESWLALTATELSRAFVLGSLVIWGTHGLPGWSGRLLESPTARALGRWSYAIYLSHNYALCAVTAAFAPHLSLFWIPWAAAGLTLGWSAAAYQWIEHPFQEWSGKSTERSSGVFERFLRGYRVRRAYPYTG